MESLALLFIGRDISDKPLKLTRGQTKGTYQRIYDSFELPAI